MSIRQSHGNQRPDPQLGAEKTLGARQITGRAGLGLLVEAHLILAVTIQLKFSAKAQSRYRETVAGEWSQTNNSGKSSN
jgi:hypothetical protein